MTRYDLIIIGSGPAGLAAAIYAQRARLNTLVVEKAMAVSYTHLDVYKRQVQWGRYLRGRV